MLELTREQKNESREHFILKQAAIGWLRDNAGCTWVAPEVWGLTGRSKADVATRYYSGRKYTSERHVADVVGIQRKYHFVPGKGGHYRYIVKCVEVKVSRADFLAGYCTGGDLNYVLALPGMVKPDELVSGVGLLECDPGSGRIVERFDSTVYLPPSVKVVRRARWISDRDRDEYPTEILENICSRLTSMWRFPNSYWAKEESA